ncbi:MAG: DUF456 family protein [Armatimonadota bacterium]|jgi:uncharacterized protein YqgC (DUF456 family)
MWMTILVVLGYILFGFVLLTGLVSTLLGLPGTAIIALDALVYSAITGFERIPWWVLVILVVLSILAEGTDSLIAGAGAKMAGGSGRTSVAAVIGTIAGAALAGFGLTPLLGALGLLGGVAGFFVGAIIPPLLGGVAGGYLGAYLYERKRGSDHQKAVTAGWGALLGRLGAGLARGLVGVIMVIVIIYTIFATAPTPA